MYSTLICAVEHVTKFNDRISVWSLDRPKGIQTTSSLTPVTSVGIVTELVRVVSDHVKAG